MATSTSRPQQVKRIFADAIEQIPEERPSFISEACGGDDELRHEIEILLKYHTEDSRFLQTPVTRVSAFELLERETAVVGSQIGVYRVVREIGRGGMGAVFLAERSDGEFTKQVAIKLLRGMTGTDEIVRRFHKERQILADLEHPFIARLIDGGTTPEGLPYFVMEYVEGVPVDRYCEKHGLPVDDRLKLFRKICEVVEFAHEHSVIHRDIKPKNILVNADGTPKLLDFGIAKVLGANRSVYATDTTATAFRIMTPDYASPEQIRGERVTATTDIYSLGVLLYKLLTGRRPYDLDGKSPYEIVQEICTETPTPPSDALSGDESQQNRNGSDINARKPKTHDRPLNGDLDNIVLKALRKEPERRFASVREFADDIARCLEGLPVTARRDTLYYRGTSLLRRNKRVVLPALCLAALFLFAVYSLGLFRLGAVPDETVPTITLSEFDRNVPTTREKGGTENPEARDLYIRGMEQWSKRTPVPIHLSIDLFEKAVDKDPQFALAYSGLANSYFLLSVWGAMPHSDGFAKARDASLKAIELAPNAPQGHLSLAMVLWLNDWNWPAADGEFRKGIDLDPNYARASHWYGLFLGEMGRADEAIAAEKRALELEPSSIAVNSDMARVFYYTRHYDECFAQYQKVMTMNPAFDAFFVEQVEFYEATGNVDELLAFSEKAWGHDAAFERALGEGMPGYWRMKLGPPLRASPFRQAEVFAQVGQIDNAFAALDNALLLRQPQMTQLRVKPTLDPLRSDPRFAELLHRMNLDN